MGEVINGYSLISDWSVSSGSATAFAVKNERKFFIKKYASLIYPEKTDSISDKVFQKRKDSFDAFMSYRKRVNRALSSVSCLDGNIVYTVDFFINSSDKRYIEVNAVVDNICNDPSKLSEKQKLLLFKTAAGALSSVHSLHLVHGDLKMTNILFHKNEAGNYVSKLIDFDCSYFEDSVPTEEIGGDQVYLSPEAGLYMIMEQDPEYKDNLTVKSDIFSLGLIFHMILTNKLPKIKVKPDDVGDSPYLFEVLLNGGSLEVDKSITGYLRNIIEGMIQLEPEDRPTALEVLQALKEEGELGTSIDLSPDDRRTVMSDFRKLITEYKNQLNVEYDDFTMASVHNDKYNFNIDIIKQHKITKIQYIESNNSYNITNIFGKEMELDEKMMNLLSLFIPKGGM